MHNAVGHKKMGLYYDIGGKIPYKCVCNDNTSFHIPDFRKHADLPTLAIKSFITDNEK